MARPRTAPTDAQLRSVKDRIKDVSEVEAFAKVCVYGVNGSGKTRFAASAPNALIIDINEHGTRSASGTGAKVFEVDSWDDIGHVYWYLKAGKHPYESVALDTVTAMQQMAMSFVLGEAEERDPSREKGMPDKRTYGRAGQLMTAMMLAFRNLPMHVIFTAQERSVKDDDTGETELITVDLPASSRGTAMGSVGVLGRMQPREAKVRDKKTKKIKKQWVDTMYVGPHEVMSTKDRTNTLGPVLMKPTMPKVIAAWANIDEEDDE